MWLEVEEADREIPPGRPARAAPARSGFVPAAPRAERVLARLGSTAEDALVRRRVPIVLGGLALAAALLAGSAGAGDEADAEGRWVLLGHDGRPLVAVVVSSAAAGADGVGVFDPAAGGETRTLPGGLLALSPTAAAHAVVWGPDLAGAARGARPGRASACVSPAPSPSAARCASIAAGRRRG